MAGETVADDMKAMFGPVKRWKEGDIYFAENSFLRMAYAVTHDRAKLGTVGIVNDIFVELISADQGRRWDAVINQATS